MILYETWLIVIGTALMFAYLFVFEPYNELVEKYLNFKPFNCVLCLSFWVSTGFFFVIGINVIYAIFTAIIAEFTYRKLVNYGSN
jgi:hypothetical protein